ncbi:MAG: bifunctional diaminohydroxyphosphoribosylaminopyrimidine deaminase/5-amino-6-(5-phosphoribosylamino)uracil reductase RibD [Coriobacteriales bacterium]|nr:bifunctional diaminohydroxyphosphoribosylaminopyrimidine deaminase/5-amino-6-(5-phosphoribosylamino)uracil reductase RibD [Coriobacteriales bacterium]
MTDSQYMQRALELAALGGGWVNPNPQVGAVIVKDGRCIGEGYHARYGGPHAEREALASCTESPEGATLYVSLEPCSHTGKTPPCTEALIASGISRVFIGSDDPNPLVAGRGIAELRAAGIEVHTGCMQPECDRLNRIFFHFIQDGSPYTLLKYAMTADGKVATRMGASQWITGEKARADVHRLRGRYAAIMVGIGTVLADDPLLNCRAPGGHNPLRVICDAALRIPLDSQIAQTAAALPTLIATLSEDEHRKRQLEAVGLEVVTLAGGNRADSAGPDAGGSSGMSAHTGIGRQRVNLPALMKLLGTRGVDSVLLEGGPTLQGAALDAGVAHAVRCYLAPKLFGGCAAPSPLGGLGVARPEEAWRLVRIEQSSFDDDLCIEGEVAPCLPE